MTHPPSRLQVVDTRSDQHDLRSAAGAPAIKAGDELVPVAELGSGGFGTAYAARSASGGTPLVVKLFHGAGTDNVNVVHRLHDALAATAGAGATSDWARHLPGVPFWTGVVGDDRGQHRPAWVGVDLTARGFHALSDVLEDPVLWERLLMLPLADRLAMAADYAEGARLLEAARFRHADQGCENTFVHLGEHRAVMIDVDSGVVQARGDEIALTAGKNDEFVAPELRNAQGLADPAGVGIGSERWALGFVLGYLVVGAHPLFFLRSTGLDVLDAYARGYRWPALNPGDPLASRENAAAFAAWQVEVGNIPADVAGTFADLVGGGLRDPGRRPSPEDWLAALTGTAAVPELTVTVVPEVAVLGETVTLRWSTRGATHVEVDGARHGSIGALVLAPTRTQRHRVVAHNRHGGTAEVVSVTVVRLPPPGRPAPPLSRPDVATPSPSATVWRPDVQLLPAARPPVRLSVRGSLRPRLARPLCGRLGR